VASPTLERRTLVLIGLAVAATSFTAIAQVAGLSEVVVFVGAGFALAGVAGLVGEGTEQLGGRLGPGATGVLQSALGNLPELFIGIFALRAGLVVVVQTALIGSILANSLLVLGLAFVAGGVRHGTQTFGSGPTRLMSVLLVLAVGALVLPFLATSAGAPDQGHATDLSLVVSCVLLIVFAASIPFAIMGGPGAGSHGATVEGGELWPVSWVIVTLVASSVTAVVVSDWFVEALRPATQTLGLSEAFVGLVIVAIAGNAVENVAGIQAAMRNQADLAVSLIQNSSLQVALALAPALVIISVLFGLTPLTLVVSPLLIASVALTAVLSALIVYDGESTWLEGLALVGLYLIVAASVWWGPAVGA
jgi:Ca2+:H+ antiporter